MTANLRDIASKNNVNNDTVTDIDIFVNGDQVEALKDMGPDAAFPYLQAAVLSAALGMETELRFGNIGIYEMANAAFADHSNLKVTLRDA